MVASSVISRGERRQCWMEALITPTAILGLGLYNMVMVFGGRIHEPFFGCARDVRIERYCFDSSFISQRNEI